MLGLTYAAAATATLPLLLILVHLLREGTRYIGPSFFTQMPRPIGETGGGMANAIVGTLLLISVASADLTRSIGAFEVTGTVFRSELRHAVVVRETGANGTINLLNSPVPTRTAGASFYALYNRDPISITALYGYTRSREWSADKNRVVDAELTPRHSAGIDLAIDADETGTRAGLEIFYTGRQSLEDNPYRKVSAPYTTVGVLVEQKIARVSIFANGENLTGVRQTRFDPLLLSGQSATGNWTTNQWAPLEGRMVNVGVRIAY